jgi:acyl carrier protein
MEERVRKLISEHLGLPQELVHVNSRFLEDLKMDSLDLVEVVMAIEKEFKVSIPDEDAEDIKSVAGAVSWLRENCKGCDDCNRWDC